MIHLYSATKFQSAFGIKKGTATEQSLEKASKANERFNLPLQSIGRDQKNHGATCIKVTPGQSKKWNGEASRPLCRSKQGTGMCLHSDSHGLFIARCLISRTLSAF